MLSPKFWGKYFEVYDSLNDLIPYQELLDSVIKHLDIKSESKILEVGSGTGNLSSRMPVNDTFITGVDSSAIGISFHRKKQPGATIIEHDLCEPLPFDDESFDRVCSNNTIYTINPDKRPQVFKELYRVIKPGEIIVIANIAKGFSPLSIYMSHIRSSMLKRGFIRTLLSVLTMVIPTIRIFYYNYHINKEGKVGSYSFMDSGEQKRLLEEAGFKDVSDDIRVYAGQGILNFGKK